MLEAVHDEELLAFLEGASSAWARGPYAELVGQDRVVPYFFPTAALLAGMEPSPPAALHAQTGQFCYDTMTVVGPGHLGGGAGGGRLRADRRRPGRRRASGRRTRCAGRRAPRDGQGYGGSCYLNNAAVAAEALRVAGHARVAVVDVDAHHGNGTQAIFWERSGRAVRVGARRPGRGLVPARVRSRLRDRRG